MRRNFLIGYLEQQQKSSETQTLSSNTTHVTLTELCQRCKISTNQRIIRSQSSKLSIQSYVYVWQLDVFFKHSASIFHSIHAYISYWLTFFPLLGEKNIKTCWIFSTTKTFPYTFTLYHFNMKGRGVHRTHNMKEISCVHKTTLGFGTHVYKYIFFAAEARPNQ